MNYRRGLSLKVQTEPAAEPVTAADVQARTGTSGDDALIEAFITAIRQQVEAYLNRALITQTLKQSMNGFPYGGIWGGSGVIELLRPPLQSVTSIVYYDTDDSAETFDSSLYQVLVDHEPGRIQVNYGQTWPTDVRADNVVEIVYDAGYGDNAADVPRAIREAIRVQVTETYLRKRPGVSREQIDNASRSYTSDVDLLEASRGTNLVPAALMLLDPYVVVTV